MTGVAEKLQSFLKNQNSCQGLQFLNVPGLGLTSCSAVDARRKLSELSESPFLHLPSALCEDWMSLYSTCSAITTSLLVPPVSGGVGGIASGFPEEGKAATMV